MSSRPLVALVTGMGGTLAPVLAEALWAAGHTCAAWDRASSPPEDPDACRDLLEAVDPDWVCHLATGDEAWAEALGRWCHERGRRLLFTSTAMVFHHEPDGPHRPGDARTAQDPYGRSKIRCEDALAEVCPGAIVARIGWQIRLRRGGNHMLETFHQWVAREGHVAGSRRWIPAASFADDTCAALLELLEGGAPGTFHLDGNAESAWDFPTLARALRDRHGDPSWEVVENDDYVHDQRLLDDRVRVRSLAERLCLL